MMNNHFKATPRLFVWLIATLCMMTLVIAVMWYAFGESLFVGKLQDYRNDQLGFVFQYPASWGAVTVDSLSCNPADAESADTFIGRFKDNQACIFSGSMPSVPIAAKQQCMLSPLPGDDRMHMISIIFSGNSGGISPEDEYVNDNGMRMSVVHEKPTIGFKALMGVPGVSAPGFTIANVDLYGPDYPGLRIQCTGTSKKDGVTDVAGDDWRGFQVIIRSLRYIIEQ